MTTQTDPSISEWQSTGHQIGMVEFAPTDAAAVRFPYYALPEDARFLGTMEADALCVLADGSLCVYDTTSKNRINCGAASNQGSFVAALKALEQHFDKCVADNPYCNDLDAAAKVRDRCTALAGGDTYGPFFTSLIGV